MTGPLRRWVFPLLLVGFLISPCLAEDAAIPILHVAETVRRLPVVFEGQPVSATFTVQNQGKEDLEILKITPS